MDYKNTSLMYGIENMFLNKLHIFMIFLPPPPSISIGHFCRHSLLKDKVLFKYTCMCGCGYSSPNIVWYLIFPTEDI